MDISGITDFHTLTNKIIDVSLKLDCDKLCILDKIETDF